MKKAAVAGTVLLGQAMGHGRVPSVGCEDYHRALIEGADPVHTAGLGDSCRALVRAFGLPKMDPEDALRRVGVARLLTGRAAQPQLGQGFDPR